MNVCRGSRGIVLLSQNLGTTDLQLGRDPVIQLLEEWVGHKDSLDDEGEEKPPLAPTGIEMSDIPFQSPLTTRVLNRLLAEYS
jgi:hypothetical protein